MSVNPSDLNPAPLTRSQAFLEVPQVKNARRKSGDRSFSSEELEERNDLLSKKWTIEAASKYPKFKDKLNAPGIQYRIGKMYYDKSENFKALFWVTKAAEGGHYEAQYLLGSWYVYGDVVSRNYEKAKELLQKSASQRYSPAQGLLDSCVARQWIKI